jgi:hypothetical protein
LALEYHRQQRAVAVKPTCLVTLPRPGDTPWGATEWLPKTGWTTKTANLPLPHAQSQIAHTREFRSILREVQKLMDWMVERIGFEL